MGSHFSKLNENTKKFFHERTSTEIAYIAVAAPVIVAQLIYIQLNFRKLPGLVPSLFGFDGNVIRRLGKWSLYFLPAAGVLMMVVNFAPKLKEWFSRLNFLKPKTPSVSAATLGLLTLFLAYITTSQVNIAQGTQSKINPVIMFSFLAAAVGLPLADNIYHAVKQHKEEPKGEPKATPKTETKVEITVETTIKTEDPSIHKTLQPPSQLNVTETQKSS